RHRPEKFSDFRRVLAEIEKHPNRYYFILKSIIVNNLYGVDIMEEAVEICKLRLFLKLVAQVEKVKDLEPLPDIDFNIRPGNTLVGFARLDDVKRTLDGKLGFKKGQVDQISEEAEFYVARAYRRFHEMQTVHNMAARDFADTKRDLRSRLAHLTEQLDRYLATEYGISKSIITDENKYQKAFQQWRTSHQPFHWFAEFYEIMNRSGFDVMIGNPPYVEYKEVRKAYQIKGYTTEPCGNLYAFTWERSIALANQSGRIGLIIPVSSVSTDGYAALRKVWLSSGNLVVSNFNDRPGKLFDGLEHIRLAIVLLSKCKDSPRSVYTTTYGKWFSEARVYLFESLSFTKATPLIRDGSLPKVGVDIEAVILRKASASTKQLQYFESASGRNRILYTRKLSWFVQVLDFVPSIVDENGRKRDPSELKEVLVSNEHQRNAFLCALNSTLFYWLLTVWSDCRNLNKREVLGFQLDFDTLNNKVCKKLNELAPRLMQDLRKTSKILEMKYKNWGVMKIECIYPKLSKAILDEIDRVLARHYGFTDEELDFIINCDIKYRMGQDSGEDQGE
ncbi:MAG: SAM-dependent methyltransferase, partial [Candidatus Zixiibacteriota bacterium]